MTYAMSDIHGQYKAYMEMLDKIIFSPSDTLYIVGDVIDRGLDGVKILIDVMERHNVVLLRGNHEQMMLDEIHEASRMYRSKGQWLYGNGGLATWEAFQALPEAEQKAVFTYLNDTPLEMNVEAGGLPYILVHGLPSADNYEKLWRRLSKIQAQQYTNPTGFVVTGHTPTNRYQKGAPYRIFFGDGGFIGIDCGCAYGEAPGRLGCLRLEDWQEYYVSL